MIRQLSTIVLLCSVVMLASAGRSAAAPFTNPDIDDYSSTPVMSTQTTPPNILVLLDNSGSMSCSAYDQNDNYIPMQLKELSVSTSIASSRDDAEEYLATGVAYYRSKDLDLGRTDPDPANRELHSTVGLRFADVDIPQGADIVSATIEFEAAATEPAALASVLKLQITGEASGNPAQFSDLPNSISNRKRTFQQVVWTHDNTALAPSVPWTLGSTQTTPNLDEIVEALVSRIDWAPHNAMAFIMDYSQPDTMAQRNAFSFDGRRGGTPPVLRVKYRTETGQRYYGYFNPEWFWIYEPNKFSRYRDSTHYGYKKVTYYDTDQSAVVGSPCPSASDTNPQWHVRYPGTSQAAFDVPAPDETTWPSICIGDAEIQAKGLFDGNFMNYISMRRIDVARQVLTGGKGAGAPGNRNLYGESAANHCEDWNNTYDTSASGVLDAGPYDGSHIWYAEGGEISYDVDGDGDIDNNDDTYTLTIALEPQYDPGNFDDAGDLSGILQTFVDDAYWGVERFLTNSLGPGGKIDIDIGDQSNDANFITNVNNVNPETSTPLGESLYVAMQYFKQELADTDYGYKNNFSLTGAGGKDPFYRGGADVSCIKSFVLVITDGSATDDADVPATVTDDQGNPVNLEDFDGDIGPSDGDGGSMDDIALFMHTQDLRNTLMGTDDIGGEQSVEIYTVYAFGTDSVARQLLKDTAKNGSFNDTYLANDRPDDFYIDENDNGSWDFGEPYPEWDENGDGVPDNYYEARDGDELKRQLSNAINNIIAKSASGTAVSVLSTSSSGEGILVQAYFKPKTNGNSGGVEEMFWAGYLQAFWVDSYGNMREDSTDPVDTPRQLDIENDKPITFFVENGDTKVKKFDVSAANPYPNMISDVDAGTIGTFPEAGIDTDHNNNGSFDPSDPYSVVDISMVEPLWEAGKRLAETHPNDRRIFTYIDDTAANTTYFGGLEFNTSSTDTDLQDKIGPYLGVNDSADTDWAYLGTGYTERSYNLINYIRGWDTNFKGINSLRNRTITVDFSPVTWKLGDIVNSTPVTIQAPPDNYGLIYADRSYANYKNHHQPHIDSNGDLAGWETMVYAGANDGMLHAFTGWKYDKASQTFKEPGTSGVTGGTYTGEYIGQELWAYIPKALLPHLKWHPSASYQHTYYVDLTPKIVDAKIFPKDNGATIGATDYHIGTDGAGYATDPLGWGTVLIGGLGLGGKKIEVDFNRDGTADIPPKELTASYFAIDITNPRLPELMWERSYTDLGMSMSSPAVVKVGDAWYVVFGSGPEDYDGTSSHHGRIYVVDLKTGEPMRLNNLGPGPILTPNPDYLFDLSEDLGSASPLPETHKFTGAHDAAFMGGAASIDKLLNNNVDAFYIGETYYTGPAAPGWGGSMYKVTIPWKGDMNQYGNDIVGVYADTPNDALPGSGFVGAYPWFVSRMFDTPEPVTATPSLSIDPKNNVWVYFGTGRFMAEDDKSNDDKQYLYGIRDPFFNYEALLANPDPLYAADYYMNYTNNLTLDRSRLFDADTWKIVHPWTKNVSKAPTQPCSDVATVGPPTTYKIGDVYGDDTCIAYVWECVEAVPDDCWAPPAPRVAPTLGDMGALGDGDIFGDGSCRCDLTTTIPESWVVVGNSTVCAAVNEGQLGDVYDGDAVRDGACIGMYWDCIETAQDACDTVPQGQAASITDCTCTVNVGAGPAYTVTEPDNIYYWPRPAGNCTATTIGQIGIFYDAADGYCEGTYWGCVENAAGDCSAVYDDLENDHEDVDVAALNAANPGCICAYSDDPTDHVTGFGSAADTTKTPPELYNFQALIDMARLKDGWFRTLKDQRERSITKPALLGGLSLFTSFVPTTDACSFGGSSYLYALYYETGTAFKRPVIGITNESGMLVEIDRVLLGTGLASGIGLHVGMQEGNEASGFIQQSTGAISTLKLDPAFTIRSGLTSWRER